MRLSTHWTVLIAWQFIIAGPTFNRDISFPLLSRGKSTSNENPVYTRQRSIDREQTDIANGIRIKIYNGSSIDAATTKSFRTRETARLYDSIDHSKPSVLYIHGFREHPTNESVRTIIGVHLQRGNDNVLLLDWSDLAFDNYVTACTRARNIARTLAKTFDDLVRLGLDLETFHCIGHSMGAQIAGLMGQYSGHSIPRITGLDPANPGFYYPGSKHIDAGSARFVDIVHTDGGFYGTSTPTGTVDFFANEGTRPQPGCNLIGVPLTARGLCSHWRSWRYYAESVINEIAFPAVRCSSYADFSSARCTGNRLIYFGYSTSTDAHGSFYFTTNDKSPFGKGVVSAAKLSKS